MMRTIYKSAFVILFVLACVATSVIQAVASTPAPAMPDSAAQRLPDDGWVLVLVPDIQSYVDHSQHYPLLLTMMQWIASEQRALNIGLVAQVGDLVYQNGVTDVRKSTGDQVSAQQWQNASKAFMLLDGVVPYITATGNHDYGVDNAQSRATRFPEYFTPQRNPLNDPARGGILAELGPSASGALTLEDAAYRFCAPDGTQWLWLSLEWGPRQAAVDWAREVATRPEYAGCYLGLVTHAYLSYDDTRLDIARYGNQQGHNPHQYKGTAADTNDGEELWSKLLSPAPNARLVLCGHMGGDGVAYLASTGEAGQTVHQMMFNAQFLKRGGNGWLRLLHFRPTGPGGQRVDVYTYSPVFALDGDPATSPWRTGAEDEFSFTIQPLGAGAVRERKAS
jgi:hypothetical protein